MPKSPGLKVVKALFAASGGVCEFPSCGTRIVHGGALLGEMCHIYAASAGGPRYNPDLENSKLSEIDNLVILCPNHHHLVDQDPATYTAEALQQMKAQHEARVAMTIESAGLTVDNRQAVDLVRQVAVESIDFAIVVALRKELDALKRYFPELRQVAVGPGASRTYHRGTVATALGGAYRVVATLLPSMGNLEAAHATADLIRDWSPRFVLVNGIAGGLSPVEQAFGDIVVSESIVYYELGKLRSSGLERRNRQFPSDRTLIAGMLNLTDTKWRKRLPPRPDGVAPSDSQPRIHVGPIASGEKVIAAAEEAGRLRQGQPNLIAVEMESAGVASVAFGALKRVGFLTVRAICDFADEMKHDNWQEYAAGAAASCLRAFIQSRPVAPSAGGWPSTVPAGAIAPSDASVGHRKRLFDRLCSAFDHEEFKNFCFLIGVDIDELPGDRKSSHVRELILLFERRRQLVVLESAVEGLDRSD